MNESTNESEQNSLTEPMDLTHEIAALAAATTAYVLHRQALEESRWTRSSCLIVFLLSMIVSSVVASRWATHTRQVEKKATSTAITRVVYAGRPPTNQMR